MRIEKAKNGLHVKAIAGTRAVIMAIDVDEKLRKGLRGFAIGRAIVGERRSSKWLRVSKVFKSVDAHPKDFVNGKPKVFRSNEHPIQRFSWSDYGAEPGTTYRYNIVSAYGDPGAIKLDKKRAVAITVTTEKEDDGAHGIWFNRGAIASQYYAREFDNVPPTESESLDPSNEKTTWLSRGLLEACLAFIDATKKGESLNACLYEFTYPPVIEAFRDALSRGVKVSIIYHRTKANNAALDKANFPKTYRRRQVLFERTRPSIPHNKFIIRLSARKTPVAVWTGSTNITMSGFLGQSNVGHLFHDNKVAKSFLDYWTLLSGNPVGRAVRTGTKEISPHPPEAVGGNSLTTVFSARDNEAMLFWYGGRMLDAVDAVLFTAAFSVSPLLVSPLATKRDLPRYVLLESQPPPALLKSFAKNGRDRQLQYSYGAILGRSSIRVFNNDEKKKKKERWKKIENFPLEKWFWREEHTRKTGNIFFIHTKYMMVDPMSDDPLICTGSANFSTNSLINNDENMVLIRGNTRVADIYLSEFFRLYDHFYFRDVANRTAGRGDDERGAFLEEKRDWTARYFDDRSILSVRRKLYFRDAPGDWADNARHRPVGESATEGAAEAVRRKKAAAARRKAKKKKNN